MTARRVALVLVGVLAFYFVLLGQRGLELVTDGRWQFVLLGIGVLILPFVGAWLVWREIGFGLAAERLGRELGPEGEAEEPLPRLPSGRVDLERADEAFARRRAQVEASPDDWRGWYRLAIAYGDARDTKRGRAALRHAIALHDADPPPD